PPRRAPLMVQVTGTLGQIGQLASAIPVAWLLHGQGWTTTFVALAVLGLLAGGASLWQVRMPPDDHAYHPVPSVTGASGEVAPAAPAHRSLTGAPPPSISLREAI